MHYLNDYPRRQQGVAILEALIAVLLFSFGILALVGLQASSMRLASDAKLRVDASYLANQKIGEMWADFGNLSGHAGTVEVSELPAGTMTTVVAGDKVTVTITWKTPGASSTNSFVSIARINNNGL
ncbi:hypothetical protein VX159_14770 [Dechloromonas sp. ZY10]|uniref:type IV pilus modification PilV family protein n=1 Tax=Dechloromonas aquae TaxID=2664436 RepID=UPI003528A1E4